MMYLSSDEFGMSENCRVTSLNFDEVVVVSIGGQGEGDDGGGLIVANDHRNTPRLISIVWNKPLHIILNDLRFLLQIRAIN